ncbi:MAG: formate dehydrogenase [Magnetospirillum sp.]|nr:formate dehydrogenase [Magnetospirillum sp.]
MTEDKTKEAVGRREFLRRSVLGAGAAGAAAVTAVAAGGTAEAAGKAAGTGYSETEHVKRYYATVARF